MNLFPLHVIAFDVPYPPTYGGVMDVFYKIKALSEAGVAIILHTFTYQRPPSDLLETLCVEIHYYDRLPPMRSLPIDLPHIVKSRKNQALFDRLNQDDIPILFEGLHTTFYLNHPNFVNRKRIVRMHNVEWDYYLQLARQERNLLKRQYFLAESRLLQSYEQILHAADQILTISPADTTYYQSRFEEVHYLPAFHPYEKIESLPGNGPYCLYHGNLEVAENEQAALFLIEEVFASPDIPLIIAGANPSETLIRLISNYSHISLRHNPGAAEMNQLLSEAHIHVLPSFQSTGIKLKLITSLHKGRFVVVNEPMILGTGLEFGTWVCRNASDMVQTIRRLWKQDFTELDLAQREASLGSLFSTKANAQRLIELIRSPLRIK